MPRAVLDISLKDEAFNRFIEKYQEFYDKLGHMSGFWDESAKAAAGAEGSTGTMVEAMAAGAASSALISEALEKSEGSSARASSNMGKIADHAKSAAKSIFDATEKLAKWAVLSLGAGLLGGGVGLFGLDRLAQSLSDQRASAMGLGITTAEQKAWDINLGSRVTDPGFLQRLSDLRSTFAGQAQLGALGIQNPLDRDLLDVGVDVIEKAHAAWQRTPAGLRGTDIMPSLGLGAMDFNEWRRIGNMSPGELKKYEEQLGPDVRKFGLDDPTQRIWGDFAAKLKEAGDAIETVLVKGLKPLVDSGALQKLSESVVHLVEKFFANHNVVKWVDDFAAAIGGFGDYLGSEKFQNDMKTFVDDIAYAASKMGDVLRYLGLLPVAPGSGSNAADPTLPSIYGKNQSWSQWLGMAKPQYEFGDIEKLNQLPPGMLSAVGWQESHLNPRVGDSPSGAQGMFQFMPATQKQYGVTDPNDPNQEANAAGMYLRDLMKEFGGDVAKALAAYNWGPANVEKDVAAHGDQWRNYLPMETKKYLGDVIPKIQLEVKVLNQTGAQVAIIANATGPGR